MNKASFDKKVKKQLWFLNKKEKQALDQRLSSISDDDSVNLNKPVTFANAYLRQNVFRNKETKSYSMFCYISSDDVCLCCFIRFVFIWANYKSIWRTIFR